MKVPTFKSVYNKAIREEKLDPIENFIAKHDSYFLWDEKGHRKFRKDLQKLVDFVEENYECSNCVPERER